ncbi:MAG TPA: carboxylating nicotinate-nucleotide diphosphorylase [Fibrobacteria bacterium]|nr:carboxylating nicotinate-nucleotide diphosphorylase [Fibrobacteria bacterium]
MDGFPLEAARRIVRLALEEDVGSGDLTCRLVLPAGHQSRAHVVAKAKGVYCGSPLASVVLSTLEDLDPESGAAQVRFESLVSDGELVEEGRTICRFEGPTRAILEAERTFLNFCQHLSGVASSARVHQEAAGAGCRVLDTRKTTPGQRSLEKWAIRVGGGTNHRMGLWDAVLVKENHAQAAGGVRAAAEAALDRIPSGTPVIIEVRDLEELASLTGLPLTRVLLDNFTPEEVAKARQLRDRSGASFALEASGGITLHTLADYARAGVEFASVGALTHSARPLDLSLLLEDA